MILPILWIKNLLNHMYKSLKLELVQRKMLKLQLVVDKSSNINKYVFLISTILISALKSLFQVVLLIHGIVTGIQLKLWWQNNFIIRRMLKFLQILQSIHLHYCVVWSAKKSADWCRILCSIEWGDIITQL